SGCLSDLSGGVYGLAANLVVLLAVGVWVFGSAHSVSGGGAGLW
ncbi:hypothetical protein A2U01_0064046, partial [Trifolium medium]|nr:hypothetical protein [Trifolium medium]